MINFGGTISKKPKYFADLNVDYLGKVHQLLRQYISLIIFCSLQIGCTQNQNLVPKIEIPAEELRIHKVQFPRENLSTISLWYTGSEKNWTVIRTYNGHLRSASELVKGDLIRIPSSLMIKTDPMPEAFIKEQDVKNKRLKKRTNADPVFSREAETIGTEVNQDIAKESPQALTAEEEVSPSESIIPNEINSQNSDPESGSQDQLIENLLPQ